MRLYDVDRILLKKTLRKRRILGFFSEKKRIIKMSPGERIYHCLNACGPLFVKFGQALSTRSDLLSEEILQHLQRLQDRAPAVDTDVIFNIIRHELGPLSDTLKIDKTPLGTASLAQVHRGKVLATGEDIAIKVLLPGIEKRVHENLRVIYMVLAVFDKLAGKRVRRLKLMTLYQEFAQTTYRELNLRNEAANASQMKSMFSQGDRGLYIHKIFWDYATSKVLVTEYMPGICIKYISRIEKALTVKQRKILAVQGVQLFFEQMLTYRFFHADLHPGNILIDCCETPCFQLIDFGIVGTLDEKDQRYLAENLLAFFKRDYQRVAQLHLESGWVSSDIRLDQFELAIRTVCEPIFAKPLKEISFARLLTSLFKVADDFQVQNQPQLFLLQKTLFQIEVLGLALDPELNLWEVAQPILETWLKRKMGLTAAFKEIAAQMPFWLEKAPHLPNLCYQLISQQQQQLERRATAAHLKVPMYPYRRILRDIFWVAVVLSTVMYFIGFRLVYS